MTQDVYSLRFDKKAIIAKEIMNWAHVRHVPIVDGSNRLVGIVTHRDLLNISVSRLTTSVAKAEGQQHLSMIPIDQVMGSDVETIGPDESIQEAARVMRSKKVGCLPVVDAERKLIGILSEFDLLGIVERMGCAQPS